MLMQVHLCLVIEAITNLQFHLVEEEVYIRKYRCTEAVTDMQVKLLT
jgi:hypothetical protein